MQYVTNEGAQGICPTGWHIPTTAEYQTLKTVVGGDGNALKAIGQGTGSGAGTNTSGFSALLSGQRYEDSHFGVLGYFGYFWSSEGYEAYANQSYLTDYDNNFGWYNKYKILGLSVRCVKD